MKFSLILFLSLFAVFVSDAACQTGAPIAIYVTPNQIFIERTNSGQELSFDFLLENKTESDWELATVNLSVFDSSGQIVLKKLTRSGYDSTLPSRIVIESKKTKLLLNPFHTFHSAIELGKLKYEFSFIETAENGKRFSTERLVSAIFYQPKTNLILPVRGRNLVYAGHDFYAHHRRVDLTNPVVAKLGVTTNPTRYGYDFSVVNEKGELYRNKGDASADWFGFGTPILAPAAGVIKEIRNDVDDNIFGQKMFDFRLVFQNIKAFYGNYVIIDHQNGEYSVLLHLKKNSITVKQEDKIKQGQQIAEMGLSGDSDYVHLHYQLQNGVELNNESLPAYFRQFRLLRGKTFNLVERGAMQTGDIVEGVFEK